MFVKKFDGGNFLKLLLYVDYMLIVERDRLKIGMLKKALNRTFSMKHLGPARQILGMHIISGPVEEAVVVALSTMEAEYMVAMEAGKDVIWIKDFIKELGIQ